MFVNVENIISNVPHTHTAKAKKAVALAKKEDCVVNGMAPIFIAYGVEEITKSDMGWLISHATESVADYEDAIFDGVKAVLGDKMERKPKESVRGFVGRVVESKEFIHGKVPVAMTKEIVKRIQEKLAATPPASAEPATAAAAPVNSAPPTTDKGKKAKTKTDVATPVADMATATETTSPATENLLAANAVSLGVSVDKTQRAFVTMIKGSADLLADMRGTTSAQVLRDIADGKFDENAA